MLSSLERGRPKNSQGSRKDARPGCANHVAGSRTANTDPVAAVLLRFQVDLGNIVLAKSVTPSRIDENAGVHGWQLSAAEVDELTGLGVATPARLVNPLIRPGGAPTFPPLA